LIEAAPPNGLNALTPNTHMNLHIGKTQSHEEEFLGVEFFKLHDVFQLT